MNLSHSARDITDIPGIHPFEKKSELRQMLEIWQSSLACYSNAGFEMFVLSR